MRISFLGKGGSGKTTLAASFIKYLEKENKSVLAIDADMNVHLGNMLDMEVNYLSDKFEEIFEFLEKDRKKYKKNRTRIINYFDELINGENVAPAVGTMPPSRSSVFIKNNQNDRFLKKYSTKKSNLKLLTVGTYTSGDVGNSCYHGKLKVLELIYNRLLDTKHDYIISDSTAGIDSVGTTMYAASDINVFVVEPTVKSISVYKDFINLSERNLINTYVICNKMDDNEDIKFIKDHIEDSKIIGSVKYSKLLSKFEKNDFNALDEFVKLNEELFNKIDILLKSYKRDWNSYYNLILDVYKTGCKKTYNNKYGQSMEKYIDEEFSYAKVIEENNCDI